MLNEIEDTEIVIGIVGAVGTNLTAISNAIEKELKALDYNAETIILSEALKSLNFDYLNKEEKDEFDRISCRMTAGDEFREKTKSEAAMALLGIAAIREFRKQKENYDVPIKRQAYIVRSLKRPEEIQELKKIYGNLFVVFSVYSPLPERITRLSEKICKSNKDTDPIRYCEKAKELIERDDSSGHKKYGQNVLDAFPLGDLFISMSDEGEIRSQIRRFFECWFGHPFHSPSKDELGMYFANAASMRSADLSRQVGASILTEDGDILTVGCNEVPKKGGGIPWEGESFDFRDYKLGKDPNVNTKEEIVEEILTKLSKKGWLSEEKAKLDPLTRAREAIYSKNAPIDVTRVSSLLEFGRIVHAEMNALMDASKRGIAVKEGALYCTTFPCHMCTRHIIAAGITRVVFIEPYPKSMAEDLYKDLISLDKNEKNEDKVNFDAFVGIAPSKYIDMFKRGKRKKTDGYVLDWDEDIDKYPRANIFRPAYLEAETVAVAKYLKRIEDLLGHQN